MNDTGIARLHHPSLTDSVREELIRLIVTGVLKPGQRLNEVHLAESLGISRGPVREAARELEGQGLVVSRPRLGSFVADFTATEIVDLYEMKVWIERALIADVIRYWSPETRATVLAEVEQIDRSAKLPFARALFEFRQGVVARIHNRYLAEQVLTLYRKFYIVTALIEVADEAGRMALIIGTQRSLWQALAAGDAARATEIVETDAAYWPAALTPFFDGD